MTLHSVRVWLGALLIAASAHATQVVPIPQPRADIKIQLPQATRSWLDERRVFRVGVGPEWPPIDQFDSAGRFTGLSGVVLDTLAGALGIRFEFVRFADFGQAVTAATAGEIDLVPSIALTPARAEKLRYTRSFVNLQPVFIGRRGTTDFSESGTYVGRTFAVERGFVSESYLRSRFPEARQLNRRSAARGGHRPR